MCNVKKLTHAACEVSLKPSLRGWVSFPILGDLNVLLVDGLQLGDNMWLGSIDPASQDFIRNGLAGYVVLLTFIS